VKVKSEAENKITIINWNVS